MAEVLETMAEPVFVVQPPPGMDDQAFFAFCQANKQLRIERTASGELIFRAPEGGSSNLGNTTLLEIFLAWSRQDGTGTVFSSSAGFVLPNGAMRAPDLAWVLNTRLEPLTDEQFDKFLPLCPDFVIELRSPSDSLKALQEKMSEYIANGARLGWLLDPLSRQVILYTPGSTPVPLHNPVSLSAEPVLPGFTLDVPYLWDVMRRKRR